ncbi:MAG: hydroxymethylglutaryl-CoA lyase [Deltaproteobacteria bacterium]|nr:hydroxymethylglutaryl-CoA lyase [Deltaproteobacteria bacterium]
MTLNLPDRVHLIEVGLRDGLQMEAVVIPTSLKRDILAGLESAGFGMIQVAAFVNPKIVPQMADADTLAATLSKKSNTIYNALVLNPRGLERAVQAGIASVEISVSSSDTHSRKNAGRSRNQAMSESLEMVRMALDSGLHVRAGIQSAFGCAYEGSIAQDQVLETATRFLALDIHQLAIADTTGMATPLSVKTLLGQLMPLAASIPVALHLHDTHGLGLANVVAAMECGVTHFDTAFGGLGGCPFVPGAAGNISTEQTVRMMTKMNIQTGIDATKVSICTRRLKSYIEKGTYKTVQNGDVRQNISF